MPKLKVSVNVDMKAWKKEGGKGPTSVEKIYPDWPIPELGSTWSMNATGDFNFFKVKEIIHFPDDGYVMVGLEEMEPSYIQSLIESESGWIDFDKIIWPK